MPENTCQPNPVDAGANKSYSKSSLLERGGKEVGQTV